MNRKEFKDEYLTDAFFFIENEDDFVMLQMIGIWFGLKNHLGDTNLIAYDLSIVAPDVYKKGERVVKNLTFFPSGKFQESSFWVSGASYGSPKDLKLCVCDYNTLNTN